MRTTFTRIQPYLFAMLYRYFPRMDTFKTLCRNKPQKAPSYFNPRYGLSDRELEVTFVLVIKKASLLTRQL